MWEGPHGAHYSCAVKGRGTLQDAIALEVGGNRMSWTRRAGPSGGAQVGAEPPVQRRGRAIVTSFFCSWENVPRPRLGPQAQKDTGVKSRCGEQVWAWETCHKG